jgi:predicted transcriptional regulator
MSDTTTVRIDRHTHEQLRRLAHERHITVGEAVARAVRLLRQEAMGHQLAVGLDDDEQQWLGADLR